MKATDTFKEVIKGYLDNRASSDAPFSEAYKKADRNIDNCVTYILNEVKKSGCNGFADQEIFDMAVHYYEAEKVDIGDKATNANVVVNHHIDKPKKVEAVLTKKVAKEIRASYKDKKKPPTKPTIAPMSVVKNIADKYFAEKKEEPKKEEAKPQAIQTTLF